RTIPSPPLSTPPISSAVALRHEPRTMPDPLSQTYVPFALMVNAPPLFAYIGFPGAPTFENNHLPNHSFRFAGAPKFSLSAAVTFESAPNLPNWLTKSPIET